MYSESDRRERSFEELTAITEMTLKCIETEEDMIKAGFIIEDVSDTVSNVCEFNCYEHFLEIVSSYIDYEIIEDAR